jgi:hypothetical protein
MSIRFCHFTTIVLINTPFSFSWHAYNTSHVVPSHCHHSYADATRPVSSGEYSRMKLWPGVNNRATGESMYGFKKGIEEVWRHQHPEDCRNRTYLISGGWPYGFGSRIHMEGVGLAIAMQMGRIYLPHPAGDNLFWVCT